MKIITTIFAAATLLWGSVALARDQISIVGSSTVFPFTQAVAEEFTNVTGLPAPVVESTGTGGGMKIFCEGIGPDTVDITGASRPMKESEARECLTNGVASFTEVHFGYDGLTVAYSRQSGNNFELTKEQLWKALASKVVLNGEVVDNPYYSWSDVDSSLPDVQIQVFGPPPTSGTRDAFIELVMDVGCHSSVEGLDEETSKEVCQRMRQDGPFIEAGENDNLIVQRLISDPDALGVFGYSFLYENGDKLQAAAIDGVRPSPETIADGSYQVSRPLFFYLKNQHVGSIPGLAEFVQEYVSEVAIGDDGYLRDRGLIPLKPEWRERLREKLDFVQ